LNSSETEEDARVGFDEVGEEAEREVGDHEEFEGVAGEEERRWSSVGGRWRKPHFSQRTREIGHPAGILRSAEDDSSAQDDNFIKKRDQGYEEDDFVELGGMARDAVAEIDGPGETGGSAVGVVGESGEEAADATDGDAESERNSVEIAGGLVDADVALEEFNGDQAEDQGTDDGFTSHKVGGVAEALPGELGVFEPVKESGTESGSGQGGGDAGPANGSGDGIAEATAQREEYAEGDDVGQSFEEEMRVDFVRTDRDIDGKLRSEME
jgi:hypothetical protein